MPYNAAIPMHTGIYLDNRNQDQQYKIQNQESGSNNNIVQCCAMCLSLVSAPFLKKNNIHIHKIIFPPIHKLYLFTYITGNLK